MRSLAEPIRGLFDRCLSGPGLVGQTSLTAAENCFWASGRADSYRDWHWHTAVSLILATDSGWGTQLNPSLGHHRAI